MDADGALLRRVLLTPACTSGSRRDGTSDAHGALCCCRCDIVGRVHSVVTIRVSSGRVGNVAPVETVFLAGVPRLRQPFSRVPHSWEVLTAPQALSHQSLRLDDSPSLPSTATSALPLVARVASPSTAPLPGARLTSSSLALTAASPPRPVRAWEDAAVVDKSDAIAQQVNRGIAAMLEDARRTANSVKPSFVGVNARTRARALLLPPCCCSCASGGCRNSV